MELIFINKILILLFNGLAIPTVGLVYFTDRRSKINLTFSISIILMILWLNFGYLSFTSTQLQQSLVWLKLNFAAVSLFFIPFYFFVIYFPKKIKSHPVLNRLVPAIFLILSYISVFTDFFIKNILMGKEKIDIVFGKGIWLFYGMVSVFTFFIIYILVRKYIFLSGREKLKIYYFLVGAGILAFFNLIFCVLLPFQFGNFKYIQVAGVSSAIIGGGLISYAILKKELFGAKIILTQFFIFLIATLVLLDFVFTQQFSLKVLKGIIFFLFLGFGYLLIKSILGEIEEKEKLKKLTFTLEEKVKTRTKELEEAKTVLEIKVSARTKALEEERDLLEEKVKQRTKELEDRLSELEKFHRLTVGRELKMIELKKEIEKLKEELEKFKGRK